jgi:hypothetical protein
MLASGVAATFSEEKRPTGDTIRTYLDAGTNPPDGVLVTYFLKQAPAGEVTLRLLDANGQVIKSFSSQPPAAPAAQGTNAEPRVAAAAGLNRFVWNLRYPEARRVPGDVTTERLVTGPLIPPGRYQVQLTVDGQTSTATFELVKDPRTPATQADFDAQCALLLQIRDKLSVTHDAINQLRDIRQQVDSWQQRLQQAAVTSASTDALHQAARALQEKLSAIEEELIQQHAESPLDGLRLPSRLNAKLAALTSVVASADAVPTQQSYEVLQDLSARIDQQLERLYAILDTDVPAFNTQLREAAVPAILPKALQP